MSEIATELVQWSLTTFGDIGGAIAFGAIVFSTVVACGFLMVLLLYGIEKYIQW